MDTPEIRDVAPPATEQDRSVTVAYVAALSRRFQKRGLAASARKSAEEQIAREEQTRALAPHSYRLSKLSQAALNGHYRKGKASMSGELNNSDKFIAFGFHILQPSKIIL